MMAPASSRVAQLRTWIRFQGVSRGTRISFRLSLRKTSAARMDRRIAGTGCDPSKSPHGAGNDDHRIKMGRSAGERHIHAAVVVLVDAGRHLQFAQLVVNDLLCERAEHEMKLVSDAVDLSQQALQIDRAAGAGAGDDEFHGKLSVAVVSDSCQWPGSVVSGQWESFCLALLTDNWH